ncbi:antifreeze protein Maxi isoform X1 [Procambarus clarkii]|uniref:antifreeze protein Maxi isoform X1 n=2 Tax=Procambarus clarkii TaxID=6728 RepID=UPI0037422D08
MTEREVYKTRSHSGASHLDQSLATMVHFKTLVVLISLGVAIGEEGQQELARVFGAGSWPAPPSKMEHPAAETGVATAEEVSREKRGFAGGYGGGYGGGGGGGAYGNGGSYLVVGGYGHGGHGPSAADIANQAASQATAAFASLGGAAHSAAAGAAAGAAAAAAAASQTAQAAAANRHAQAAQITQAAQGAQAAAFQEASLAGKAHKAEQAAKVAHSMARALVSNLGQVSGETNALAGQATGSLAAQESVLNSQNSMAWQAQQAANSLRTQQNVVINDLHSAAGAASQAQIAASKALAKAKGANNGGFGGYGAGHGFGYGGGYH